MAARRIGIIGLLLCLCLCLLPCYTQAASTSDAAEPIMPERDCTLTISYGRLGTAVSGVNVKLYQIAEISADAQYTLTPSFAASAIALNEIQTAGEWNVIRTTLESYILANDSQPILADTTGGDGQVHFEALQAGLYLAVAGRAKQVKFSPVLITLPGLGADRLWQYEVTAAAKPESTPIPVPGPELEPTPEPENEIQYKVLKLWKEDEGQIDRPKNVEVAIFRDGELHQTVILSEENHWSYSWKAKADGADWMAVERNVPEGYAVTVEERSTAFVLTNTRITEIPPEEEPPQDEPPLEEPPDEDSPQEEPPQKDSPKTGDTSNILLYTMLMYASGIVLVLLGITGKRKHHEKTK